MRKLALVLFLSGFTACVQEDLVHVESEAKFIQVIKVDDKPFHCKVMGAIQGVSRSKSETKARDGAENDLRNKANALKANYALVEVEHVKPVAASEYKEVFLGGKALKCDEAGS